MPEVSFSLSSLRRPALWLPFLLQKLRAEVKDWPIWWKEQSRLRQRGPLAGVILYFLTLVALHGFRSDHLTVGFVLLVLSYGGRSAAAILEFLFPIILTAILYDSMRFYSDYIRGTVHVDEPYLFDKRFFGIQTSKGVLTPNEWLQLHTSAPLDLITGFAYLVFIAVYTALSAFIYFWSSRVGTSLRSAEYIRERRGVFGWGFFWVNIIGYTTYYWYPAAPPWYVALYGLGPANMSALPNPAGCARFDQMLGTHFFTQFYGRSADVFGAIPSLHVAYPLMSVYFAFRFGTTRVFSVLFWLLMSFAAVYLNHHYVLDVLCGFGYALVFTIAVDFWYGKKARTH